MAAQAQRGEHDMGDGLRVRDRGELDQPDAIGVVARDPGGGLEGQARLTDPARTGQRGQPGPGDQPPHRLHLPAHQSAEGVGEVRSR